MFETYVFPALQYDNMTFREMAIQCLALCALNDKTFGTANLQLLMNPDMLQPQEEEFAICRIGYKFLFDWLVIHGLTQFTASQVLLINCRKLMQ